jgi:maltose-binding protein MalE
MIEIGGGLWWDIDTDVRTLYYRRDMLQDAGIDPAELDAENGPITVARITEIAAAADETKENSYSKIGFIPWVDCRIWERVASGSASVP